MIETLYSIRKHPALRFLNIQKALFILGIVETKSNRLNIIKTKNGDIKLFDSTFSDDLLCHYCEYFLNELLSINVDIKQKTIFNKDCINLINCKYKLGNDTYYHVISIFKCNNQYVVNSGYLNHLININQFIIELLDNPDIKDVNIKMFDNGSHIAFKLSINVVFEDRIEKYVYNNSEKTFETSKVDTTKYSMFVSLKNTNSNCTIITIHQEHANSGFETIKDENISGYFERISQSFKRARNNESISNYVESISQIFKKARKAGNNPIEKLRLHINRTRSCWILCILYTICYADMLENKVLTKSASSMNKFKNMQNLRTDLESRQIRYFILCVFFIYTLHSIHIKYNFENLNDKTKNKMESILKCENKSIKGNILIENNLAIIKRLVKKQKDEYIKTHPSSLNPYSVNPNILQYRTPNTITYSK